MHHETRSNFIETGCNRIWRGASINPLYNTNHNSLCHELDNLSQITWISVKLPNFMHLMNTRMHMCSNGLFTSLGGSGLLSHILVITSNPCGVMQTNNHTWQGYPGISGSPKLKSMRLPGIFIVTWQLWIVHILEVFHCHWGKRIPNTSELTRNGIVAHDWYQTTRKHILYVQFLGCAVGYKLIMSVHGRAWFSLVVHVYAYIAGLFGWDCVALQWAVWYRFVSSGHVTIRWTIHLNI